MWYCINEKNHVVGSNPNDMSGNSGWIENSKTIDNLTDENGIALYALNDGEIMLRAQEEMTAVDTAQVDSLPTLEERVAKVEAVIDGAPPLAEMIEALNILLGE